MTWTDLRVEALAALGQATEARWMLEQASGLEGAELELALGQAAPGRAVAACRAMVARRASGEPLQYVLGRWGFRGLDLLVDRRVLIPRPETEQLVEAALAELSRLGAGGPAAEGGPAPQGRLAPDRGGPVAVDLGTGSGAVALALAAEEPSLQVWATDQSTDALAVARANLAGLGRPATRVRLAPGSWYLALPPWLRGQVRVVVSNPPYVAEAELDALPAEVRDWEPLDALVAGPSGLEGIRAVLEGSRDWLARSASVVVELAPHQAEAGAGLAREAGFPHVAIEPDLSGRARVLVART